MALIENKEIVQLMSEIKNENRMRTPTYTGYNRSGYKYRQERLRTNNSYEASKYQQTQTSVNSPLMYRQLFGLPKYNTQQESYGQVQSQFQESKWQMFLGGPSQMQIGQQAIAALLADMKLVCFKSHKNNEMKNYIQRKKMVVDSLRIQIEEKQAQVSRHKSTYEKKYKEMMKKKIQLYKYRKMVKEVKVSDKHWWALAMKRLEKKIDRKRMVAESFASSQYDEFMPQKKLSFKDRPNRHYVQAPTATPKNQHCSRRKNNSVYTHYNNYIQEDEASNDDTLILIQDPQRPDCYKIRRAPSLKKSDAKTRVRTQGVEQHFVRMSKKKSNTVRYVEDFQTSMEYEAMNRRNHIDRNESELIKKNNYTTEVISKEFFQYQTSPISNKKERKQREKVSNEEYLSPDSGRQEHFNIKQIISHQVSEYEAEKIKQSWQKDQQDEELAELIQKSINQNKNQKEETNKLFESDDLPQMMEMSQNTKIKMLKVPQTRGRSSEERSEPSKVHIVVDPEGKFKKSEESRSESDTSDKRWSLKQPQPQHPTIVESLVNIDISDMSSSKISKRSPRRERSPSIPNEYTRTKMRNTMCEEVMLIREDPAQFGSLQTTQNNVQKKGQSLKSISPQSSLPNIQIHNEEYATPLKRPPQIQGDNAEGLISSIQLNAVSRPVEQVRKRDSNEFNIFKENTDDFLAGINLNSQSRISRDLLGLRQSTPMKGSPRGVQESPLDLKEDIPAQKMIDTKSEFKPQGRTSIEDELGCDLDFDLTANSRIMRKPANRQSLSQSRELNRNSYPMEMSSQPIEEEQSEESASNHIIKGRKTIRIE